MRRIPKYYCLLILCAASCNTAPNDKWEKSPGVTVTAFKDIDHGKPYLTVLYENFGTDSIEKIKYQLITETRGKIDTTIREIDPPKQLLPKDRHSIPRQIGEDTVSADYVHAGEVWVVKSKP